MKKLFNSSAAKITKVYATMLIGITLAISIAMIVIVGTFLFNVRVQETKHLMNGIEQYFVITKEDWKWWRAGTPMDTKTTFIKAELDYKNQKNRYFYSPGARKFIRNNETSSKHHHLLKNTYYSTNNGVYYRLTKTYTADPSENLPAVHYQVWMKFDNSLGLLGSLIKIILVIALIGFLIGTILIYWLARRLNRPLVALTNFTKNINNNISRKYTTQLPVSKSPQEVHDLSEEFNKLLNSLNQQSMADRTFVSNASHELKTPIAGIRGHAALIKRRGMEHPEIIPNSIDFIDDESKRVQEMIESLLRLSHANQLELTLSRTNLSDLVTTIVKRYEREIKRPIRLKVQRQVMCDVNANSIEQILISLIDNARKYSDDDTSIDIALSGIGKEVVLTVSDHGPGIPDQFKDKVFERFYRVEQESEDNKIPGTGLGLAIVKQLVTLNNGQITIEDNIPHGSIFKIKIIRK